VSARELEDANRLLALGLRPKQLPGKDVDYAALVERYNQDDEFKATVQQAAAGLGLLVLDVGTRTGAVLAATEDSVFQIKMDDYSRRAAFGGKRSVEKLLHGVTHLAVAALGFPRPDDLANDSYVGRVSVEQVDGAVREACRKLHERASAAETDDDPLDGAPELERVWRTYLRRPEVAQTKDGRIAPDTTRGMVGKALRFLTEEGMLTLVGAEQGGIYRTTPRYQVQVRELASLRAFDELLELGVVAVQRHGQPALRPAPGRQRCMSSPGSACIRSARPPRATPTSSSTSAVSGRPWRPASRPPSSVPAAASLSGDPRLRPCCSWRTAAGSRC
jgi:hypothetical protein